MAQAQLAQSRPDIGLGRPVDGHLGLAGENLFQLGVPAKPTQQHLQVPQRLRLAARHAGHLPPKLDRPCRIGQRLLVQDGQARGQPALHSGVVAVFQALLVDLRQIGEDALGSRQTFQSIA